MTAGPYAPPARPRPPTAAAVGGRSGQVVALIHPHARKIDDRQGRDLLIARTSPRSGTFRSVSVLETLLLFGVPSVGIYLLIWLAVVGPKRARAPRHRVGQAWGYAPLWWTANPEGAHLPTPPARSTGGTRGGARGSW